MRDIKFRAWDNLSGTMLANRQVSLNIAIDGLVTFNDSSPPFNTYGDVILMQFTGLIDRHGVEIYEGDIVLQPVGFGMTDDRDLVGEVRMLDASWCSVISIKDGMTFVVYFYEYTKPSEFIVIGNIYEHPDLLDKKGE